MHVHKSSTCTASLTPLFILLFDHHQYFFSSSIRTDNIVSSEENAEKEWWKRAKDTAKERFERNY
jgi:hypothetical protein